jgi:leader peptidase (prepilin peptidase)/N-methyltransferase
MGLLWFAVTLRLAGQGLGWPVPAYLALAFVCLVLAVIDAATRLLPNRITYPAFPVVAGLLLAPSPGLGELGRLGRGLLAAASVGGLFLPLALLSPHGMGWAAR